jgi:hypothetical protein
MLNLVKFFKSFLPDETSDNFMASLNGALPAVDYLDLRREAIVTQPIEPGRTGQVKFQGSWWTARCDSEIVLFPNQLVHVIGRLNATMLLVEPITVATNVVDLHSASLATQRMQTLTDEHCSITSMPSNHSWAA